jgi:subtilase family protein
VSSAVRRLTLTGVVVLACCAPAQAAPLAHPGRAVVAAPKSLAALQAYPRTLVELDRARAAEAEAQLLRVGGEPIARPLALWRLPSWTAQRLLPGLLRGRLVRSVTPDVPVGTDPRAAPGFFAQPFADPLAPTEWWIPRVGADRWTAPGPGVPLTMIDSGVDLSHEEFATRSETIPLNTQTYSANDDELHGTATSSVAAAPENGVGIVGIYPQAKLQLWDASPNGQLTVGDEIQGLFAARRSGRGVINLSLGGFDRIPIEEHAIMSVFEAGSLVVASVGNDREGGSEPSYPASFAHVVSVGASDEADRVTDFSSSSPAIDLAAPGQDMPAAIPKLFNANGYATVDGTSFSAPLVSGAAAAVWTMRPKLTNTQLFEVMRRSSRDVGKRGWDADTGLGVLDVVAALARAAPASDPQEPNEDIYLVKPNGLSRSGHPPLTTRGRLRANLKARVERYEDPEDVYRVFLPARGELVVTMRPDANLELEIWGRRTRTVFERGAEAKRDLIAVSSRRGKRFERVTVKGRGVGQFVYVDVFLAKSIRQGAYSLSIAPAAR